MLLIKSCCLRIANHSVPIGTGTQSLKLCSCTPDRRSTLPQMHGHRPSMHPRASCSTTPRCVFLLPMPRKHPRFLFLHDVKFCKLTKSSYLACCRSFRPEVRFILVCQCSRDTQELVMLTGLLVTSIHELATLLSYVPVSSDVAAPVESSHLSR